MNYIKGLIENKKKLDEFVKRFDSMDTLLLNETSVMQAEERTIGDKALIANGRIPSTKVVTLLRINPNIFINVDKINTDKELNELKANFKLNRIIHGDKVLLTSDINEKTLTPYFHDERKEDITFKELKIRLGNN